MLVTSRQLFVISLFCFCQLEEWKKEEKEYRVKLADMDDINKSITNILEVVKVFSSAASLNY